jgi:hypothetical protein
VRVAVNVDSEEGKADVDVVEVVVCVRTELNVAVFDEDKVSKDVGVDVGSEEAVAEYNEDSV